jgi:hypothetical protein
MQTFLRYVSISAAILMFSSCEFASDETTDIDLSNIEEQDVNTVVENLNPSTGSMSDAISLNNVVWHGVDVSSWPVTASLNAYIANGVLWLSNNKENEWPGSIEARGGGAINGVAWVFVEIDGTWHAATWEWLRRGQHSKLVSWVKGTNGHIHYAPLNTWVPRSGETYGFMVSTPARGGVRTINERSNISLIRWP